MAQVFIIIPAQDMQLSSTERHYCRSLIPNDPNLINISVENGQVRMNVTWFGVNNFCQRLAKYLKCSEKKLTKTIRDLPEESSIVPEKLYELIANLFPNKPKTFKNNLEQMFSAFTSNIVHQLCCDMQIRRHQTKLDEILNRARDHDAHLLLKDADFVVMLKTLYPHLDLSPLRTLPRWQRIFSLIAATEPVAIPQ